jgi:mannonate dehydratase
MNRRQWLARSAVAAPFALVSTHAWAGPSTTKLTPLKITDIKTILTAPAGIRLVVVKVQTSEPGLYGLGCATFTQRARAVEAAVDKYLRPFLIGKDPALIEDTWQSRFVSSYWRNGPVLGNAIRAGNWMV